MTIPVSTECALPVTGWSNRRRANSNRSRVIPNALKKLKIDRRQPSNGLRRNSPRPLLEQGRIQTHSRRRPAASSGGTARPRQMLDAPRRAQSGVQSVQKQPAFSEQAVREEAGDGLEAQTAAAPEGRETLHKRRRRGRRSAASQAPELRPESQTVQNTLNK